MVRTVLPVRGGGGLLVPSLVGELDPASLQLRVLRWQPKEPSSFRGDPRQLKDAGQTNI